MRLVYDVLVGIVASIGGNYIILAMQKLLANAKEKRRSPTKKRR